MHILYCMLWQLVSCIQYVSIFPEHLFAEPIQIWIMSKNNVVKLKFLTVVSILESEKKGDYLFH